MIKTLKYLSQKVLRPWEKQESKYLKLDCPPCIVPVGVECAGKHETGTFPCHLAKFVENYFVGKYLVFSFVLMTRAGENTYFPKFSKLEKLSTTIGRGLFNLGSFSKRLNYVFHTIVN